MDNIADAFFSSTNFHATFNNVVLSKTLFCTLKSLFFQHLMSYINNDAKIGLLFQNFIFIKLKFTKEGRGEGSTFNFPSYLKVTKIWSKHSNYFLANFFRFWVVNGFLSLRVCSNPRTMSEKKPLEIPNEQSNMALNVFKKYPTILKISGAALSYTLIRKPYF